MVDFNVNFDFGKYDIGGKDAVAGNGTLEGAEVEAAKKDGWNTVCEGASVARLNSIYAEIVEEYAAKNSNQQYAKDLGNPDNWIEATAQPPMQAPTTGPSPSENPEYDKIVRGGYVPKEQDVEPQATTAPETTPKTESSNEKREIKMKGANGSYSIKSTKNGGYEVLTNFTITQDNPIKNKFDLMETKIFYNEKNRMYTVKKGGIIARNINQSFARQFLDLNVNNFIYQHTVYTDLLQRQNNGIKLTEPEQKFMAAHLKQMEKLDINFDANGNIVD